MQALTRSHDIFFDIRLIQTFVRKYLIQPVGQTSIMLMLKTLFVSETASLEHL